MEIQGYENYLIYPDGRVYSKKNNIFLKPDVRTTGYCYISLYKQNEWHKSPKIYRIHRLVAKHYIPNPENKPFVDHIDRNTLNNDISNLRWVTHLENMNNQGMSKNNTSGHKNISKNRNSWIFQKRVNGMNQVKYFKSLTDCLCYKFIFLLMLQAKIPVTVLSFK